MTKPFHGAELIAALPIFTSYDVIDYYVIAVKRHGEYVTGIANTLTDTAWSNGHYFTKSIGAVADMYVRAGVATDRFKEIATMEERIS